MFHDMHKNLDFYEVIVCFHTIQILDNVDYWLRWTGIKLSYKALVYC